RGIEIGHIFQLGYKYTDAFEVDVLGENGKPVRLIMGSYGIGVSRMVAPSTRATTGMVGRISRSTMRKDTAADSKAPRVNSAAVTAVVLCGLRSWVGRAGRCWRGKPPGAGARVGKCGVAKDVTPDDGTVFDKG
uniref:hypothetical protein n=1 Tax=Nocardia farcinica TaxID=37329 RepID=UPI003CC802CC